MNVVEFTIFATLIWLLVMIVSWALGWHLDPAGSYAGAVVSLGLFLGVALVCSKIYKWIRHSPQKSKPMEDDDLG
jgi:hypothetical protein